MCRNAKCLRISICQRLWIVRRLRKRVLGFGKLRDNYARDALEGSDDGPSIAVKHRALRKALRCEDAQGQAVQAMENL